MLALALQLGEPLHQLRLDSRDRPLHPLRTSDIVRRGEDVHLVGLPDDLAGERMQVGQALDLVAEQLDAYGELLVHGEHLDGVTADAERATTEGEVVAGVLDGDEPAQQCVPLDLLPDPDAHHPVDVFLWGAQTVDAADACYHDHIPPCDQCGGSAVPQPLDLLVDRGILLDVGIGLRDVGLGLVVVVVAHKILDRVVGQ